ncbi:MAG TPA: universal stress protein [Gemmatimonadaceae bacterium]|nr:universal stress protein [Gemmatimonadaceae bacterium]
MEYHISTPTPAAIAPSTDRQPARTHPGRPLLVAMTAGSAPAVVTAARLAAGRLGGRPEVVAVRPSLPLYLPDAGVLPLPPEVEREQRQRLHSDLSLAIHRAGGEAAWPVDVLDGDPARTIARLARERHARLIVMGIGRHAPLDRLFGSETALQTIRLADRPVLAVAPGLTALPRHVVVAVDFSPASVRAAEEALALVADGGTLTLLHVRPPFESLLPDEAWDWARDQRVQELFQRVIAGLEPRPSVRITPVVRCGDPAAEVLAVAERETAELIATGSSGIGFFARLMVGSVATRLLRRATVSVLAVPRPSAAEVELIERQLSSQARTPESARWATLLAAFGERNAGRRTQLELDDAALGARLEEQGYLLVDASYDRHEQRLTLTFRTPAGGARLVHTVEGVTGVAVLADPRRRDLALQAKHGRGQTIVTFLDD